VLKPQQALDDPHVGSMPFFERIDYPGLPRPAPLARTPALLSNTPGAIRHRAPTLGEHTDSILAEIGYAEAEIAALRERGVV
jgi:crotonobetainyl-CoA:carnitine CoA-transferase CaiB-like acyl-CoA transferase